MHSCKYPDLSDLIIHASATFLKQFQADPTLSSYAPGRVNLIGEHTDYNNGFVLPMALPLVTVIVGAKNNTNTCHIFTSSSLVDEPKEIKFQIPDSVESRLNLQPGKPAWGNYIKGVIANFKGKLFGFNAVINTSVPLGGGLSSSAALEIATYYFLESLTNEISEISLINKAMACQKAEHDFLGMPCGIMDQFISVMGEKDHALFLDCRSLEYQLIEMVDPEITVLITNTNVRHKLAESQYANRKIQCEKAAEIIGRASLRDVSLEDLESYKETLGAEIYFRALHVVTEIKRTIEAADALKQGNYERFGNLMTQSHQSLRDSYGVSCIELDTVVNAALDIDGVYGSRMTGGGFGGCTVSLLKTNAVSRTLEHIKMKYDNPTFYVCRPGDGAQILCLKGI